MFPNAMNTSREFSEASHVGSATSESTTVLILDDESCVCELLGELLSILGYETRHANSPDKALAMLDKEDFAVVLSDLRMPQMDGQEFYKAATLKKPSLARRIIFLTGDVASEETQLFLNETGSPFIPKPFELAVVDEAIAKVLGRSPSMGI